MTWGAPEPGAWSWKGGKENEFRSKPEFNFKLKKKWRWTGLELDVVLQAKSL